MSNIFGINLDGVDEYSTKTSPFVTDQVFKSREELMEWAKNTSYSLGFVIVTKRSKAYVNDFVYKVILMCDRGGRHKTKDTSRSSGSKKINCKFELEGKYSKEYDRWMLKIICDEHNHPPAQYMEGHPFARRLSDDEFRLVEDLTAKDVEARNILAILKEQNKNNVSTLKTIYNSQQKIRMAEQAGRTPMQVLMSLLHANNYVHDFTTGGSNELENLFFVHPTSWEIWRAFPHVLIIDATYKTNKYNKPFVQIVGVTSTQKTFSIAFAFMHREKEANYTWVLNCLKSTVEDCMLPRVIITDRELALINACKQVFPNATRLLCRWHIEQNILNRCKIKPDEDKESFKSMWKLLIQSPTWEAYMENYKGLQSVLAKHPGLLKYIEQTWLNNYKEMFVSAWIDQSLNFGNRTTNRVESQHSLLKSYFHAANLNLDKFVKTINQMVQLQQTAINESFEKSRIFRYKQHNLLCFELLRVFVSNEALDIMVGELQRAHSLKLNSSNCGCQVRNSCGLPCACMLSVYSNSGEYIPLDSIDVFWRKLDLLPMKPDENDNICCDDDLKKFKENFSKQSRVGKRSFLRKLKDIFQPGTTTVEEPVVQKNTRGRPNLKKQQKKNVDPIKQTPGRHSYSTKSERPWLDLNNEPKRHSYSIDLKDVPESYSEFQVFHNGLDLNQEPDMHNTYSFREPSMSNFYFNQEQPIYTLDPLMNEIPQEFHPYVGYIKNVNGDGNCGFRSIAISLGRGEEDWRQIRSELYTELLAHPQEYAMIYDAFLNRLSHSLNFFGSDGADEEYWLIMPDTAILIANTYGVIVIYLTKTGSSTWFPHRYGPQDIPNPAFVVIAHVHTNHYVMVSLQGAYPMPPVLSRLVRSYRSEHLAEWETFYTDRLNAYVSYKSYNAPRNCNTEPILIYD